MMLPTIHMNGTSKKELERQIYEAAQSVRLAMNKLNDSSPNGRDYYPQGPDAIRQAIAEHNSRAKKLKEVYDELISLFEEMDP